MLTITDVWERSNDFDNQEVSGGCGVSFRLRRKLTPQPPIILSLFRTMQYPIFAKKRSTCHISYWKKLTKKEIKQRVDQALNRNVDYHERTILGIPASHLDETAMEVEHYRHPSSNIVAIRARYIKPGLAKKYGLVPDSHNKNPQWYKIVLMEQVHVDHLMPFVDELRNSL